MGQIPVGWWRPVASGVPLDLPYRAICSASHKLIITASKIANKGGLFFVIINFMLCITVLSVLLARGLEKESSASYTEDGKHT